MEMNYDRPQELLNYDVLDDQGQKIGDVEALWQDENSGELEFLGVKTGWLMGKTHIVPANDARLDADRNAIQVPYSKDMIKDAPAHRANEDLSLEDEREVWDYYGVEPGAGFIEAREGIEMPEREAAAAEDVDIPLSEEEMRVGKREVPSGEMRLRKIVRTEHVEEPVELRREEIEIDREPAHGERIPSDAFEEKEYRMQEMHEEPIVEKDAHVREVVHAKKHTEVEREEVEGDIRREDVEIDRDREDREFRERV